MRRVTCKQFSSVGGVIDRQGLNHDGHASGVRAAHSVLVNRGLNKDSAYVTRVILGLCLPMVLPSSSVPFPCPHVRAGSSPCVAQRVRGDGHAPSAPAASPAAVSAAAAQGQSAAASPSAAWLSR